MSIKDLFGKTSGKILDSQEIQNLYEQAESEGFLEEIAIDKERYLPPVDFSTASNFARYGSAEKYYSDSIRNIYENYPYDGSRKEKQQWRNNSSQFDLYVFDNIYPKSAGYVTLTGSSIGFDQFSFLTSSNHSYIKFHGGPNNPSASDKLKDSFVYSNKFDLSKNRGSNLAVNVNNQGNTIEFWAKRTVNLINGYVYASNIFNISSSDGSFSLDTNINNATLNVVINNTSSLVFNYPSGHNLLDWNHYSICLLNKPIEDIDHPWYGGGVDRLHGHLYINGKFVETVFIFDTLPIDVNFGDMSGVIGCKIKNDMLISPFIGSIDEFRFWKEARSSQEISRNWFTPVGGGSNTDDSNTELGIYYKFNEGISGDHYLDCKVIDYSGRVSNGTIINYNTSIRSTSSAIDLYFNYEKEEEKDPIIYSQHPLVLSAASEYTDSGRDWDIINNSNIMKSLPDWIVEEDENKGSGELSNLVQIISSYFDTVHLQIENLSKLKDIKYYNQDEKQLPFANKLLSSFNFENVDIFSNTTFLEEVLSRNETGNFEKNLLEIKNAIYQNIYNNLSYIYKSKGTEKAIRNLIRCFGVDDELIKINLYADNSKYNISNGYNFSSVKKKFLDFNNSARFGAFVCGKSTPASGNDVQGYGVINGSSSYQYIPLTLQSEVIFPKKIEGESSQYTNFTKISLFGLHEASGENTLNWGSDRIGLSVLAQKRDEESKDVQFILRGNFRNSSLNNYTFNVTSSWFKDVYENEKWNLALRIKHEKHESLGSSAGSTDGNYVVELYGVNTNADTIDETFLLTTTVPFEYASNGLQQDKRVYVGAHCENYDTSYLLEKTDVKISSVRFWFDYLSNEEIQSHALDAASFGRLYPSWNAYPYMYPGISKQETLALNWEFNLVTGSDSSGEFFVEDSSQHLDETYINIASDLKKRHTGVGINFPANDSQVVNIEYIYSAKQQTAESISSTEMVQILQNDDVSKTNNTKPTSYFYSIEKSMYQVMNDHMLKWFATIKSFNNILGEPLEKYSSEYKTLNHLRRMFFEQVGNTPDFEKFLEFYKWIDSSISLMINQLIPASANVSENVRNVVESHIFERNKYENKLPIIDSKKREIFNSFSSNHFNYSEQNQNSSRWLKSRLERTNSTISSGDPEIDKIRETIRNAKWSKNLNSIPRGYNFSDEQYHDLKKDQIRINNDIIILNVDKQPNPFSKISPISIENVELRDGFVFASASVTGSEQLFKKNYAQGNYINKYEYFNSSGRTANNLKLSDIYDQLNNTSSSPYIIGLIDRQLINRPNIKTVFVERFSSPGGPEVNGRGMLDKTGEEYSVYNTINNRNLTVRKQLDKWSSETSSLDPENVSYHKINKNRGYVTISNVTKNTYDNLFITRQIPRSDSQYSWVTASIVTKPSASGFYSEYDNVSIYNNQTAQYLSGSNNTDYLGLNLNNSVVKKVDIEQSLISVDTASLDLNAYLLNINGPYQGAGWKLNFKFNNKLVSEARKNNILVVEDLPVSIITKDKNGTRRSVSQLRSGTSTSYRQPPVEFNSPMTHEVSIEGSPKNIVISSTYENNKNKLSNLDLVKRTRSVIRKEKQTHEKLLELESGKFAQKPEIVKIKYVDNILPRKDMVGLAEVRTKPNYDDNGFTGSVVDERTFWRDDETNRTRITGALDLYKFANNSFSSLDDNYAIKQYPSAQSSEKLCFIDDSDMFKESIFSADNQLSIHSEIDADNFSLYRYDQNIKGNLSKNSLSEEIKYITNIPSYDVNNYINYVKSTSNFYNIKNDITPYTFLYSYDNNDLAHPVQVKSITSSSIGIFLVGNFKDKYGNYGVTLWNGQDLVNINSPFTGTLSFSPPPMFCSLSTSWGIYVGSDYQTAVGSTSGLFLYNGNTWSQQFTGSVFSMITSSDGILIGTEGSPTRTPIYRQEGSYWQPVGAATSLTPASIVSGSNALYFADLNTSSNIVYKYTGSLTTPSTSIYSSVGSKIGSSTSIISGTFGIIAGLEGVDKTTQGIWHIGIDNTWRSLSQQYEKYFIDGDVYSLYKENNDIYIGGSFTYISSSYEPSARKTVNNICKYSWDTHEYYSLGREGGIVSSDLQQDSKFRVGVEGTVYCISKINSDVIAFGGQFNKISFGPKISDIKGNIKYILEGYLYPDDLLIPHPQLIFNNFIPPIGSKNANYSIDKVIYDSNNLPSISTYTKPYTVNILNEGYIYETSEVSNKKPFFDSYEKYIEDIKPNSQKYVLIPEYNISDYMVQYVKDNNSFKVDITNNYLKLNGTNKNYDLNDTNNKINITNVLENKLLEIDEDSSNIELSFKVSGLKKFLPKKDFYPSERITTLSSYFINSFVNLNLSLTSSYNINDKFESVLSNGTPINGQILTLLQPLFSPGILLNTIKSSLAVDWPVYISSSTTAAPFYSSTGSSLSNNAYSAPSYLNENPTLRLPFEALIEFDNVIPDNLKSDDKNLFYLNPTHYNSHILYGNLKNNTAYPSYNMGIGSLNRFSFIDSNYKLAMHNFLAEIPNLFLKNKLNKFVSSKTRVNARKDVTYSMDIVIKRSDKYKSFLADPLYENKKKNINSYTNGTLLIPSADSVYGPPTRYWNNTNYAQTLFNVNEYNFYFKTIDTPAYAPYVPPYFYGASIARVSFTADETREYSIKEIVERLDIQYINDEAKELFRSISLILSGASVNTVDNYSSSPSYKNMMSLSSSLNLKQLSRKFNVDSDPASNEAVNISNTDEYYWSIQTKFETPSINFSNVPLENNIGLKFIAEKTDTNGLTAVCQNLFKGIWTTYGQPATENDGITLKIQNPPGVTDQTSLAKLCGFDIGESRQIGAIADNKIISEAVVLIPFSTQKNHGKSYNKDYAQTIPRINGEPRDQYYFIISREILKQVVGLSFDKNSKVTIEQIKSRVESNKVDQNNSIIKMIRSMIKYVIPPHLDWLRNKDIEPFVMYLFEFDINLDTEDLSDIWQGLMPKASNSVEEDEVVINHKLLPNELFHAKRLPNTLRFKTFKVKQKANINYYQLTEDSLDDERFKFKFGNSQEAQRPEYSYNWPYDFCSIVEYVNVEAGIEVDKTKK